MPRLSVIMPVYNAAPFLGESLPGLLGQSFKDFELIAVDDGSTDGSGALLEAYARADARLKPLRAPHRGAGAARNLGMARAGGEYLLFLDADDRFMPDMFQRLLDRAEASGAEVCVCPSLGFPFEGDGPQSPLAYAIDRAKLPPFRPFGGRDCPDSLFLAFTGWPWDKLFKRALVEGLRFSLTPTANDLAFVYQALARAERIDIAEGPPLVLHRQGRPGSLENRRGEDPLACLRALGELKAGLPPAFMKGYARYARAFLLWNLRTLPPRARLALLRGIGRERKLLQPR